MNVLRPHAIVPLACLVLIGGAELRAQRVSVAPALSFNLQAETSLGITGSGVGSRSDSLADASAANDGQGSDRATPVSTPTLGSIQRAAFADKEQLASDLEKYLNARAAMIALLKARVDGARSPQELETTLRALEQGQTQLKNQIKIARGSREEEWKNVRLALLTNYSVYSQTVARAEALLAGGAKTSSS